MFEGFSEGRVAAGDGVEIAYVMGGAGPTVLLLHGFPQTRALWAKIAPRLARRFTVVCPDLRGYGDSGKPADTADHAPYAFRAMADDQMALMRSLGFSRFHLVGHDRGARVAHRLALDHPRAVASLTLMDIVPTLTLYDGVTQATAMTYWHWYFLPQPAPFPETLIAADPELFFTTSLAGWGAARTADFDAGQMAAYRRAWSDPETIRGMCCDYRAAASIDLVHDRADEGRKVDCPALVLYGREGAMGRLYDVPATWRDRLARMQAAAMPGGHFFVDLAPDETAARIEAFLEGIAGG